MKWIVIAGIGAAVIEVAYLFGIKKGVQVESGQIVTWLRKECRSEVVDRAAFLIEKREHWRKVND